MKARDYLEQVKVLEYDIINKRNTLKYLNQMKTEISSPGFTENVQTSSNPSRVDKLVCKIVGLEQEIDEKVTRLIDLKCEVLSVLHKLEPIEYDVLFQYYMQEKSIKDIAHSFGKSDTWVRDIRLQGEEVVQSVLDERENLMENVKQL